MSCFVRGRRLTDHARALGRCGRAAVSEESRAQDIMLRSDSQGCRGRRWVGGIAWIAGLAACGSVQAQSPGGGLDAGASDAPVDASVCYGTGIVRVCVTQAPRQPLMVAAPSMIDTDQSNACTVITADGYCAVVATDITIAATLRVTGSRPLVLVADGSITVAQAGVVDVGSHRGAVPELGTGAEPKTCGVGSPPGVSSTSGGGAGGSFADLGGDGGAGFASEVGGGRAGPPAPVINQLRGGCAGQNGARTIHTPGTDGGIGGHGGGAVFLIAGSAIDVLGKIDATGEAGRGGPSSSGACGGGGGGSGGMIGFDAPAVQSTGLILASGGGGGQGADFAGSGGLDGADPTTTFAALGGTGSGGGNGGSGGDGSSRTGTAGKGADGINVSSSEGGGGGGGGGAGFIKAPATATLGANISPVPMQ